MIVERKWDGGGRGKKEVEKEAAPKMNEKMSYLTEVGLKTNHHVKMAK